MKHVCVLACTIARQAQPKHATSMPETTRTGASQGKYRVQTIHAFAFQDVHALACA